jgi:hypothetical protein
MLCHSAAQQFHADHLARVCPFVVALPQFCFAKKLVQIPFARAYTAAPHHAAKSQHRIQQHVLYVYTMPVIQQYFAKTRY